MCPVGRSAVHLVLLMRAFPINFIRVLLLQLESRLAVPTVRSILAWLPGTTHTCSLRGAMHAGKEFCCRIMSDMGCMSDVIVLQVPTEATLCMPS